MSTLEAILITFFIVIVVAVMFVIFRKPTSEEDEESDDEDDLPVNPPLPTTAPIVPSNTGDTPSFNVPNTPSELDPEDEPESDTPSSNVPDTSDPEDEPEPDTPVEVITGWRKDYPSLSIAEAARMDNPQNINDCNFMRNFIRDNLKRPALEAVECAISMGDCYKAGEWQYEACRDGKEITFSNATAVRFQCEDEAEDVRIRCFG